MAEHEVSMRMKLLTEGVKNGLTQAERLIGNFASRANRQLNSVGKTAHNIFSGKFSFFGGAIAGVAIYETIRKVGEFDDSVRMLGRDANMSTGEMLRFKQQILDTSMKLGVSTEDLTGMSRAAYEASHDMGFVNKEFEFMAKYAQASGASAEEVGKAMGELSREIPADQLESAMKFLGAFGTMKGSRMTAKQFLPFAGDVLKAAQVFIKSGEMKNANKMIAEAEFTGNPQAVIRAYMAMHRHTKKQLRSIGILQGMSLTEGIDAVFANPRVTDKMFTLEKVFGSRGILTGLQPLITDDEDLTKSLEEAGSVDFMSRQVDASKTFSATLNKIGAAFMSLAGATLSPVLDQLAEGISKISPEDIDKIARVMSLFGKTLGFLTRTILSFPLDRFEAIFETWSKFTGQQKREWKASINAGEVFGASSLGNEPHVPSPSDIFNKPTGDTTVVVHNYIGGKEVPSEKTTSTVYKNGKQAAVTKGDK